MQGHSLNPFFPVMEKKGRGPPIYLHKNPYIHLKNPKAKEQGFLLLFVITKSQFSLQH